MECISLDYWKSDCVSFLNKHKETYVWAVFCYFLLKRLESYIFIQENITIWENKYGCAEHYRCETILFSLPILSLKYDCVIYWYIVDQGHTKDDVDSLNAIDNIFWII